MSEVPEEIMTKARKLLKALIWDMDSETESHEIIARALLAERLAERERCAKVADAEYEEVQSWTLDGNPEEIAERIAAAIRAMKGE